MDGTGWSRGEEEERRNNSNGAIARIHRSMPNKRATGGFAKSSSNGLTDLQSQLSAW